MPPTKAPANKFHNSTPVIWHDGMIHAVVDNHGYMCYTKGGLRVTLVQALVYLSNSQWCESCWGKKPPRLKFRAVSTGKPY
jgi:hypothetical protein